MEKTESIPPLSNLMNESITFCVYLMKRWGSILTALVDEGDGRKSILSPRSHTKSGFEGPPLRVIVVCG